MNALISREQVGEFEAVVLESSHLRAVVLPALGGRVWELEDVRQRASIRMDFDARELPFMWMFLSYGGWRDTYTAVLEPCSNMPKDLPEAVRLRQSARLEPGRAFETTVSVTLNGPAEPGL